MVFYSARKFNGSMGILGWSMLNRQHGHQRFTVLLPLESESYHAGPIFAPFFMSVLRFVSPQIRIGYDKPRFGRRDRHAVLLLRFRIEQCIEMIVARIHTR